jgi:protein translocase SecG subunit
MVILYNILLGLEALASIALVILMVTQTSKNEGFGTIGVQTPTNFKGKPGFEERLQMYTRNMAIGWFVLGFLVAAVHAHIKVG